MVKTYHVEGYDGFWKFMETFKPEKHEIVHILFEGSKDPETNQSWCSDCLLAEPVIKSKMSLLQENSHFIFVAVGDRATWKNPQCPFRTDKRLRINVVPTLIRWKNPQRLEGEQLENPELVEMLFTDTDDD